jgi:hypothetical protein
MKRIILAALTISIPALLNAAATPWQGNAQLVVAVQDNGINFGSDSGTTSSPNGGMNTMPTKDVGNESDAVNQDAPVAKPGQAPAFNPTPAFDTPPAYTPETDQSGDLDK